MSDSRPASSGRPSPTGPPPEPVAADRPTVRCAIRARTGIVEGNPVHAPGVCMKSRGDFLSWWHARNRELVVVGAWGTGPFDNDDALDFFLDLEDATPERIAERVREALTVAADGEAFLEEHAAGEAIAAAAVVAYWCSPQRDGDEVAGNPRVAEWLATRRLALAEADTALALRALDHACGERSEWAELWEDAGHADEARAAVKRLRQALTVAG